MFYPHKKLNSMRHQSCRSFLVLFSILKFGHGSIDVPAQYYTMQTANHKAMPSIPFLTEEKVPEVIRTRIGNHKFLQLPTTLQGALLWEHGLLPARDTTELQQVYVNCGKTMNDVFIARGYVWGSMSDRQACNYDTCNAFSLVFSSQDTCFVDQVETATRCGILEDAHVPSISRNPMWSEDGTLDGGSRIQITKYVDNPNLALQNGANSSYFYLIEEKPQIQFSKNNCPNKASFIVPCRKLTKKDVSNSLSQWCRPEKSFLIDLWLEQLDTTLKLSKIDQATNYSMIAVILAIALLVAGVLCSYLFYRLRSVLRQNSMTKEAYSCMYHRSSEQGTLPFRNVQRLSGAHQVAMLETVPKSQAFVQDQKRQKQGGWWGTTDIDVKNQIYLKQSEKLGQFFDDSQLIMKRIAYASIHLTTCVARKANGEVWKAEYDGQFVAVKRMFTTDQIKEIDHALQSTNLITKSGRKDSLVACTKMEVFRSSQTAESIGINGLRSLERFAQEIRLSSSLHHPNIVRFVGLAWRTLPELCMVSEYMEGGDLSHVLRNIRRAKEDLQSVQLTWRNGKLGIATNIANALVYLHSMAVPIVHRDIKSLNVLISDKYEAKLNDFGLSREVLLDENMTSGVGTFLWTAPEVLRGDKYTEKADVYSFGIVLSELDTCYPPYHFTPELEHLRNSSCEQTLVLDKEGIELLPMLSSGKVSPRFSEDCPPALERLARSCLALDPEERPNAMQIAFHLRSKVLPTL